MMTSTANAGDSLSILLTAFCEAACANPSITSAETASLPVSDIVAEADNETGNAAIVGKFDFIF